MYRCLSTSEKKNMFKSISIKTDTEHINSTSSLIISIHGVKDESSYNYEMLSFSKFNVNDRILITDLVRRESGVEDLNNIFSAVCEKVIEKFIKLTTKGGYKKLAIFTKEPIIQEILLKNKFSIIKSTTNVGVVATLNIK